MSILTSWVLSVVGIVIVGVLIDLILPDGQMNKYIKGIFGIITVFVIVSPITQILNYEIDFDQYLYNSTATQIDEDYIEATKKLLKSQTETFLEKELEKGGFSNVFVNIEYNLQETSFVISSVVVDIKKMVINGNVPHINKYTEIKDIILNSVTVKEGDISFNEWKKGREKVVFRTSQFAFYSKIKIC